MDETNPTTRAFLDALAANPFDKLNRDLFADWLDECGDTERATELRNGNVVLSGIDTMAAADLRMCNFAPATADKRFARELVDNCFRPDGKGPSRLSPRRFLWMWCLLRRYRRSVSHLSVRMEAEKRYHGYLVLLDLDMKKPRDRRLKKNVKTEMRPGMFDDQ